MTRSSRVKRLNTAKPRVIAENVLKQNPEGFEEAEAPTIVVMDHIPEYRKVVFLNGRDPGVALHFHYASKTHPLKHYTLYHGFEHELPLEIIDHLESCAENQYAYRKTPQGEIEQFVNSKKYIFQFRNSKKAA